jgi:hypothetical protein
MAVCIKADIDTPNYTNLNQSPTNYPKIKNKPSFRFRPCPPNRRTLIPYPTTFLGAGGESRVTWVPLKRTVTGNPGWKVLTE